MNEQMKEQANTKQVIYWLIFFYCLGLLFIVLSAGMIKQAFQQHLDYTQCREISEVEIVGGRVEHEVHTGTRTTSVYYYPIIEFKYSVNGHEYSSERFGTWEYDNSFTSEKDALRFLQQYPRGTITNAYYNPEHPEEAFLVNHLNMWVCVGFLFTNTAAFVIFLFCLAVEDGCDILKLSTLRRLVMMAWWCGAGVMCFGYYFMYADKISAWYVLGALAYIIITIIWGCIIFHPSWTSKK